MSKEFNAATALRSRKTPSPAPGPKYEPSGELLSLDRLEEYAVELAARHKIETRAIPARPLLAEVDRSSRTLADAYVTLAEVARRKLALMPGDEWILDNYHIVTDNLAEVRVDLPRQYYLELPRLSQGQWSGLPRVYALAWELILHTDGVVNTQQLDAFLHGYQSVQPLSTGELWAIPIMFRLTLLETLARLVEIMLYNRRQFDAADSWADRLVAGADTDLEPLSTRPAVLQEMGRAGQSATITFLVRMMQRMRDVGPPAEPVLSWVERRFQALDTTPEEAIRSEYSRQTAIQASVGNAITSLRTISGTSWANFIERHSIVHAILLQDPVGVYAQMDFATRDRYRHVVERIFRRSTKSEEEIAQLALQFAQEAHQASPNDLRHGHVGFYLVSQGRQRLREAAGYRSHLGEHLSVTVRAHPFALYLGSMILGTTLLIALSLWLGIDWSRTTWAWVIAALVLATFPASELALSLVDQIVTMLLKPRVLPKLDLSAGIPREYTTFVVIPTLLRNREDALDLARHVEILYLANPSPNLYFAILSDYPDAAQEEMPTDSALLETISSAVRELNLRYGDPNRFYLFHRNRQWNPKEGVWMGWERKRGKLVDFNALLLGRGGESFTTRVGGTGPLPRPKFVITLDRDTDMPHETAHRLVGTLAHPLNRPEIDPTTGVVMRGYGILQPRVNATWESAIRSRFSSVFSGHTGVDPYTTAVSNAYQDLFGEGIYIGKGIYDLQAFETATGDRFPSNTLLSHDLLEGCYARVGYASDIELYEDFPAGQNVFASREHRWVRGDWQILPWLFPTVPTRDGRQRNPLSSINRWKIIDNLRRSLVPPASVLLIALSWTVLPGSPLFWTLGVLVMLAFPFYSHLITSAFGKPPSAPWQRHWLAVMYQVRINLAHFALTADFYAYRAALITHAILATLTRMYITHTHLLEWVTASEAQHTLGKSLRSFVQAMWFSPLVALAIAAGILLADPRALPLALVLLVAWAVAPAIAYWVSKPIEREVYIPSEEEKRFLRRVARKSWRYFEEFVTPAEHWLAPDNFQQDPKGELAHRSSPTNLSLLLLSTLSAYDLGYLTASEFAARIDCSLTSMEGLERFNGHFYNWYNTTSLEPLYPRYISTVDSGNLIGHLLALKQGCLEMPGRPLFSRHSVLGLQDVLSIIEEQLAQLDGERMPDLQAVERQVASIGKSLQSMPSTLPAWTTLFNSLVTPTANLATEVRSRFPGDGRPATGRPDSESATQHSALADLVFWTERLAHAVQAVEDQLKTITPWAEMLEKPHPLLERQDLPEIEAYWKRIRTLERSIPSLRGNLVWCANRMSHIRRLQTRIRDSDLGDEGSAAIRWLERLRQRVAASWTSSEQLISRLRSLAARSSTMIRDMNFEFLYDKGRKLFAIGYNVTDLRLDHSFYDLLASEARLASYVAIARGEVPREHWFALGRPITGHGSNLTLLSWTGTMFEYLMPTLVMPLFEGTLLDRASRGAVLRQQQYAQERAIPWGISEAAFSALDTLQNYNYRAFGVPGLGLKRGLSEDLVVAPYATVLALTIDPRDALANLRRLSKLGMEGRYGFYESIDFTRSRLPQGEHSAIVETFMVHHLGMTMVSVDNYLHDNQIVRRFGSESSMKATGLLLQERVPLEAPIVQAHPVEVDRMRMGRETVLPVSRAYKTPNTSMPHAHVLSNGRYSVVLTNSGTGYSKCGKMMVTRWRNDPVVDTWGQFIYVRDAQSGKVWSAAAAPLGGEPTDYSASFTLDRVEYRRREGDIETHTEVVVSPEDDAEVRRVTLTNRGNRRRVLELTSYAELALAEQATDSAHPAFSKMFIETEYLPEYGAIIAKRRPRSMDEQRQWVVHVVAFNRDDSAITSSQGLPISAEYDTDRALFLGRGRSAADPFALESDRRLRGRSGVVLDPIMSLRERVRVGPGTRVRVSFVTAVANSREEALALADKYHDHVWTSRALRLALAHSRVQLRQLGISGDEAMEYQRLFSRMIYPRRATAPSPQVLARNVKGQQGLWAYGISGDLPILLVSITDPRESEIVRQALHAHEYWQSKGFQADMVVLNEYPGGYIQPVQEELERLVTASHAHQMLNKPGGVYVKRADLMPDADRVLLNSVARVILKGNRGKLAEQLDRKVKEPAIPSRPQAPGTWPSRRQAIPVARRPSIINVRQQRPIATSAPRPQSAPSLPESGFTGDGREFVIVLHDNRATPLPWTNIIANPEFGCMVTESSLDTAWAVNSRQNRLNPWSNDPVSDPPSQAIYIRDDENGQFWTPTPLPVRAAGTYTVRHGQGYTVYSHGSHELDQTLWVYVAPEDPVQILKLTLRNRSARPRRLSITYYNEWVLGVDRETFSRYVITDADPEHKAILARNHYNSEFADRVAFATTSARDYTFTGDRAEFLGPNGSLASPVALGKRGLSGSVGAGLDPCAALQCPVQLAPGAEQTLVFVLGEGENVERARTLTAHYRELQVAERAGEQVMAMWDRILGAVEVETPDKALDALANRWLLYQAISCRYWGRSAFYQGGGAYGFRDQLQDVMALIYTAPEMAREHILRCAEHQFKEGDVQHWWHPPGGRGVRTRISDDLLWLPFVTAYYVEATGDMGILDEKRPFLEAPELEPGQEDMYSLPTISEEQGTLYEHCLRAIKRGDTRGPHGLPLMGTGDWNDGMNRVGIDGQGESVWVAWFLYATLAAFAPLCEARNDKENSTKFCGEMDRLKEAIEDAGWDGKWYRRAYFDDGTPLGSAASDDCKIDAIAQSWSVIAQGTSGSSDPERVRQAMDSVAERLVRGKEDLVLLLTPPFDKGSHDPGYIKGYPPGIRENGGQYTHGAVWTVIAHALLGDGDEVYRLFSMLNPTNHAKSPDEIETYQVEPYVIAADVYSHPQHVGRGGWTWYTGSASWYYRLIVQYMLGLKRYGDSFTVEPCIPSSWPGYSLTYRYGTTVYHITVDNNAGVSCGVASVEMDGKCLDDGNVPLSDDGKQHEIMVTLGSERAEAERPVAAGRTGD